MTSLCLRECCGVLGIFLAIAALARAQSQGMKDYGNRLEGTNVRNDASEDFTLLGIHRNFVPFPPNSKLNVRFFLPRLLDNRKRDVFVEAVEIQDLIHYFMRSKSSIQWKDGDLNIFQPWSTNDVIDPRGIQADNVGVLAGYQVEKKPKVYLPADVYPEGKLPLRQAYTFHFLTGQALQSLEISVTNAAGMEVDLKKPSLKCDKGIDPNCKQYAAGTTLKFDLDMSSLPDGEYHLRLVGHVPRHSDPTSLDIALYHHSHLRDGH